MKSEAAHTQTFRLSKRLRVEITAGAGGLICEWTPRVPDSLTSKEARAYRAAFHEMAQCLGVKVLIVEIPRGPQEKPH